MPSSPLLTACRPTPTPIPVLVAEMLGAGSRGGAADRRQGRIANTPFVCPICTGRLVVGERVGLVVVLIGLEVTPGIGRQHLTAEPDDQALTQLLSHVYTRLER